MGELRRTVEETVPFHLLKDVVARWRENLMITKVRQIKWDDGLADEIDAVFAELSRHIEGHSHTGEYQGVPDLDDLRKMIDRVDAIVTAAKQPRAKGGTS